MSEVQALKAEKCSSGLPVHSERPGKLNSSPAPQSIQHAVATVIIGASSLGLGKQKLSKFKAVHLVQTAVCAIVAFFIFIIIVHLSHVYSSCRSSSSCRETLENSLFLSAT